MPPKTTKRMQVGKAKPRKPVRQAAKPRNTRGVSVQKKSAPLPIGSTLGGMVGGLFGQPAIGSALGGLAQKAFTAITGIGDYQVKNNTLIGAPSNGIPQFLNSGNSTQIMHREFIKDINGSVAFENIVNQFVLNPGNSKTFPWLSVIAAQYEQYEFKGLVFEFKSTSATSIGSTNTALGVVIMATSYDVYDAPFTTKQAMEAYEFSCSGAPSVSFIHPIECDPNQNVMKSLFINDSASASSGDERFYDQGLFQLATSGMQAVSVIGELWVTYHVELRKPKMSFLSRAGMSQYTASSSDGVIPYQNYLINPNRTLFPGSWPITYANVGYLHNHITFNLAGTFLINISMVGTFSAYSDWTIGNVTPGGGPYSSHAYPQPGTTGLTMTADENPLTGTTAGCVAFLVRIVDVPTVWEINPADTGAGDVTTVEVYITAVDPEIVPPNQAPIALTVPSDVPPEDAALIEKLKKLDPGQRKIVSDKMRSNFLFPSQKSALITAQNAQLRK